MKIGYIGLGKMGKNMVLRLLEKKIEIVAWNRSPEPVAEVVAAGAIGAASISDMVGLLPGPRIVWLMLPAGEVTDVMINELEAALSPGDLVVDGANSYYPDSVRHFAQLANKGIEFVDIGVSGGPGGARNGACLMIGGEQTAVQKLTTIFEAAALPNSWAHVGSPGAGHFAKMVHNGIEYGMMQAIGEGAAVLKYSSMNFDMAKVFDLYNKGSVIESRLVGWAEEALREDENLSEISAQIAASGEGEWTVNTAKLLNIDVPVIEKSLDVRKQSQIKTPEAAEGYRNKMVSALREKFGHHKVRVDKTSAKA